jgi:hypothetical protein
VLRHQLLLLIHLAAQPLLQPQLLRCWPPQSSRLMLCWALPQQLLLLLLLLLLIRRAAQPLQLVLLKVRCQAPLLLRVALRWAAQSLLLLLLLLLCWAHRTLQLVQLVQLLVSLFLSLAPVAAQGLQDPQQHHVLPQLHPLQPLLQALVAGPGSCHGSPLLAPAAAAGHAVHY